MEGKYISKRFIAILITLGSILLFGIVMAFVKRETVDVWGHLWMEVGGVIVIFTATVLVSRLMKLAKNIEREKKQILEERDQLQVILASMGEGLIVINKKKRVTLMNERAATLLRIPPKEGTGKMIRAVFPIFKEGESAHPSERTIISNALKDIELITITVKDNYFCKDKTGRVFPIAFVVESLLKEDHIIGAVILLRDITLEKEVDRAKSEFVSLASHQLRTPLSIINWYTEILLDNDVGAVTGKQRKSLSEIYHATQRMVELVNALLNVSRIELGTFIIQREPVEMVKLAQDVLHELEPAIIKRALVVDRHWGKTIPPIHGDPKLLRIVIQNLITNAIKYTPQGGKIDIALSLDRREIPPNKKQQKVLLLTVSDTGYGIPRSQQSKIFTKLFRADNVKERETDGTGLGLYIVQSIITHSGGSIWFESEENKGTKFFVTIPLTGMRSKVGTKTLQ